MVRRVVHWTKGAEEESKKKWREKTGRKRDKQATASGEQGCTISAEHVSYDSPVKYCNDKFWNSRLIRSPCLPG